MLFLLLLRLMPLLSWTPQCVPRACHYCFYVLPLCSRINFWMYRWLCVLSISARSGYTPLNLFLLSIYTIFSCLIYLSCYFQVEEYSVMLAVGVWVAGAMEWRWWNWWRWCWLGCVRCLEVAGWWWCAGCTWWVGRDLILDMLVRTSVVPVNKAYCRKCNQW